LAPDRVDAGDRIGGPDDRARKLSRRPVEGIDDDRVVEPQVQRAAEYDREQDEAPQARHEGFLDAPAQVQVSPDHDVDDRQRDDGRLERCGNQGGIRADVGGELSLEPGPEGLEKTHDRAPTASSYG